METNRLKQFRIVVETGSLRKASELLRMTHGALSKSIKVLESQLGVTLLIPAGRGIRITEQGREVYDSSFELIESVERLMARWNEKPLLGMPTLRIVTFEIFSTYFLASLLGHLGSEVRLVLTELLPGKLERAVVDNVADIGITYLPIPTVGIEVMKVESVSMGIFARTGSFRETPTEELPFAVPIPAISGSPIGIRSLDGWPETLFARRVQFEVDLLESALQLSRNGYAAVYIPHFIARLHNQFVAKEFQLIERAWPGAERPANLDVYLETRNGYLEDKYIRKIAKAIRLTVR